MKTKGIPKYIVYLLLVIFASVPLFFDLKVPGQPSDPSVDTFKALMSLKEGDTVLIATDWTGSTRGESKAHMTAVLKILMRKGVKFALWSSADPQAPKAGQDVIGEISRDFEKENPGKTFKRWDDWVNCGFYPNSDVAINNLATDVKKMFGTRKETDPQGVPRGVFESPVLQNIQRIEDFKMVLDITASKTSDFHVQFVSSKKVPLVFAVTGVMVPETQVYYNSGQIAGFLGGLKGVFDLEQMMENGLNVPGKDGKIAIASSKVTEQIPGFPGMVNTGNGSKYYPTLHFALLLMIGLVVKGNLEMLKARKEAKNS
ncbi:MAG TPA: hypothetical protein VK171_12915 [Fimbriimonas sp.]|nr:hypothetical protein [Fimbriimonas sp.]